MRLITILFLTITLFSSCDNSKQIKLIPVALEKWTDTGEKWGYVDVTGNMVITPKYRDAKLFNDGVALVLDKDHQWGFIKEDGTYIIKPTSNEYTEFNNGLAWVVATNSAPSAINKDNEIQFTLKEAKRVKAFSENLSAFSLIIEEEEKWGFVNTKGDIIIKPQFTKVNKFHEGLCAVKNNSNKWGFINKKGELIINYQFDGNTHNNLSFIKNNSVVKVGDKYGVIDKEGKYLINPQYDNCFIDEKKLLFKENDKWGWSDFNGKKIVDAQFDLIWPSNNTELQPVFISDKWGYVNGDGNYEINPQFKIVVPFNSGYAFVSSDEDKFGVIDKSGKYIVNPKFISISEDYAMYLILGYKNTLTRTISSDFFDIEKTISVIDFKKPEGLSKETTYRDIQNKYELMDNVFDPKEGAIIPVSSKKIDDNVEYSFVVLGNPYELTTNDSHIKQYNVSPFRLDKSKKPNSYKYHLVLNEIASNKKDYIITKIEEKLELDSFKKISEGTYTNEEINISIGSLNSSISIFIDYVNNEKSITVDEMQSIASLKSEKEIVSDIREKFAAINSNIESYKKVTGDMMSESSEGSSVEGYYKGDELRKLVVEFYGHLGRLKEEYYFWNNKIFFVYTQLFSYNVSITMKECKVDHIDQNRYYFYNDKLVRWLDPKKEKVDNSKFNQKEIEILNDIEEYKGNLK